MPKLDLTKHPVPVYDHLHPTLPQKMKLAVKQPSESMPNLLTEGEEEEEEDMAVDVDHVPQTEEQMEQGEDDDDEGKFSL